MNSKIIEALFFPSVENEAKLAEYIGKAKKEIDLCIFTFTNKVLAMKILELAKKNVKIRIISDDVQSSLPYSLTGILKHASDKDIEVRVDSNKVSLMHNKYIIIDKKIVITGSFNYTNQAVRYNNENVVIMEGKDIYKLYSTDFNQLWDKYQNNSVLINSTIKKNTENFINFVELQQQNQRKQITVKNIKTQQKILANSPEVTKKINKAKGQSQIKIKQKNQKLIQNNPKNQTKNDKQNINIQVNKNNNNTCKKKNNKTKKQDAYDSDFVTEGSQLQENQDDDSQESYIPQSDEIDSQDSEEISDNFYSDQSDREVEIDSDYSFNEEIEQEEEEEEKEEEYSNNYKNKNRQKNKQNQQIEKKNQESSAEQIKLNNQKDQQKSGGFFQTIKNLFSFHHFHHVMSNKVETSQNNRNY